MTSEVCNFLDHALTFSKIQADKSILYAFIQYLILKLSCLQFNFQEAFGTAPFVKQIIISFLFSSPFAKTHVYLYLAEQT